MIINAGNYISELNPDIYDSDNISIFQISEVLAICTGKLKEDIVIDIIENMQSITYHDRVKLFHEIWGTIDNGKHYVGYYLNMDYDNPEYKTNGFSLTREELLAYINSGFKELISNEKTIPQTINEVQLIQMMDFQCVPKYRKSIKLNNK